MLSKKGAEKAKIKPYLRYITDFSIASQQSNFSL